MPRTSEEIEVHGAWSNQRNKFLWGSYRVNPQGYSEYGLELGYWVLVHEVVLVGENLEQKIKDLLSSQVLHWTQNKFLEKFKVVSLWASYLFKEYGPKLRVRDVFEE